jgi:hypothetical protein
LHINNFGAISSFLVLNDPFEEREGEKTWEKKKSRAEQSRAWWWCCCLLESGEKGLLTLGFLLGEILPKWAFFFLFFWVENGDLKKVFPRFSGHQISEKKFNFHIFCNKFW